MAEYVAKRDRNRCPTHPGELLREDVIPATGKTRSEIAALLGISRQHLYDILNERKPVSPTVAVRLGKLFGDGAGVWARMQSAYDTWNAERELSDEIKKNTHNQNEGGVKKWSAWNSTAISTRPSRQLPRRASGLHANSAKDETVENLVEEIMAIGKHCAALPQLDARSADEIIGYDKRGLPQ